KAEGPFWKTLTVRLVHRGRGYALSPKIYLLQKYKSVYDSALLVDGSQVPTGDGVQENVECMLRPRCKERAHT
ncbi:hypothetical protein HW555_005846, partial [Spodoptera exigua]